MVQFAITTRDRVKTKKGLTGSSLDAAIDSMLPAVSQMAEDYLGRRLLAAARTEVFTLQPRTRYVRLLAFPVSAVASVKYSRTRDFTGVDAMDASSYQVLQGEGQLYLSGLSTWSDPGFIEVVYTGGMAADTAAFIAAYPRIADAADNELCARLNRNGNPDGSPQAINSSVAYAEELKPLTDFYEALKPHRRLRL